MLQESVNPNNMINVNSVENADIASKTSKTKKSNKKVILIFTLIYFVFHLAFDIVGIAVFTKVDVQTPSIIMMEGYQSQSPYAASANTSWSATYI